VQEAIDYLKTISGGASSGQQASYSRQKFTATAAQTTFSVTYTVGYLEVYLNGVLLDITDYTASTGTTVVLSAGAQAGDELVTIALDSFAIAELLRVTTVSPSAPTDGIVIGADGQFGIGIANPIYKFMVGDGTRNMCINPNSTLDGIFIGTTTNKPLLFGTNDFERARIDINGNFLLGSTANYNLRAIIAGPATAASTGSGSYIVASFIDTNAMAAGVGGGLGFQGNDGQNGYVTFASINGSKENGVSGNYASYLSFKTRANGQALTERMTIGSNGLVTIPNGIQAKAPTYELYGGNYNEAGLTGTLRIRLGTVYIAQGGMDVTIKLAVGAGYNAGEGQVFEYVLRLRTSNGSSSTAGSSGAIYINGFVEKITVDAFGTTNPVESFLVQEINTGQYNIYFDPNSLIGNYSHYIVETPATATWVHNPAVLNISEITGNYLTVSTWRTTALTDTSGFISNTRGIKFPAYQFQSSDPNTLDDYEEGTWTPSITGGDGGSVTYNFNSGVYRKIGSMVYLQFGVNIASRSGGSGEILINGLPFPSITRGAYQEASASLQGGGWANSALAGKVYMFVMNDMTQMRTRYLQNSDAPVSFTDIQAGTYFNGTIVYCTAA
jgi:hypothetical protein